jgi:hypothetical protein
MGRAIHLGEPLGPDRSRRDITGMAEPVNDLGLLRLDEPEVLVKGGLLAVRQDEADPGSTDARSAVAIPAVRIVAGGYRWRPDRRRAIVDGPGRERPVC